MTTAVPVVMIAKDAYKGFVSLKNNAIKCI